MPTGAPVFKRGMNATGVFEDESLKAKPFYFTLKNKFFEDARYTPVHIYAPASSGTSSLRMIPTFYP